MAPDRHRARSFFEKGSSFPEGLKFVERARPVLVQQAGKSAVGEQASSGLASRTIIGLVAGIANTLDLGTAARARLAIAAVDRHAGPKRGYLLGKCAGRFGPQALGPFDQRRARRVVKPLDFLRSQLLRHRDRRELRAMENLVGIRIADTTENMRVGERTLQRMISRAQRIDEGGEARIERFDTSGIQ